MEIRRSGRRKGIGGAWNLLVLGVALMVGIGLIGPAMAMWNQELIVLEKVTTGKLTGEVFFTDVNVKATEWGNISARIDCGAGERNHRIRIDIDGVYNQSNWALESTIENQGTIPVRCLVTSNTDEDQWNNPLAVTYELPPETTELGAPGLDPGQSVDGKLRIELRTDMPGLYPFQVEVKCIQWNADNDAAAGWWSDTLYINGVVEVTGPPL